MNNSVFLSAVDKRDKSSANLLVISENEEVQMKSAPCVSCSVWITLFFACISMGTASLTLTAVVVVFPALLSDLLLIFNIVLLIFGSVLLLATSSFAISKLLVNYIDPSTYQLCIYSSLIIGTVLGPIVGGGKFLSVIFQIVLLILIDL